MRFRSNLGGTVHFPYGGVVYGRDVAPGALSPSIPPSRIDHPVLQRDLGERRITLFFEPTDTAVIGAARIAAIEAAQAAARASVEAKNAASAEQRTALRAKLAARRDARGALRVVSPRPAVEPRAPIGLPSPDPEDAPLPFAGLAAVSTMVVRDIGKAPRTPAVVDFGDAADWVPGNIPPTVTLKDLYGPAKGRETTPPAGGR